MLIYSRIVFGLVLLTAGAIPVSSQIGGPAAADSVSAMDVASARGTGVRIFTSERRAVTLGVGFHHISNGDRSGSNRGLNQFVIYAGFSVFK